MGGACNTYWGRRGACRALVGKSEGMETDRLEHPGIDWTISWIFRKWYGGTDWIYLAQERDRSRVL